ncbi:hypothetical protein NC653_009918 [Populus alba x Populus x berolinensis]|uniref:Uncharacterized protein n=1 Tax=Populus alba x Populus x berolinensis TaxID=444605 RepID=A0AAD6RA99_9ROSI|nr:hypothetical protein NC653_009918 [Populus alba x Populus x berolinensis]
MLDSSMNNLDGVLASKTFGLGKLELTHVLENSQLLGSCALFLEPCPLDPGGCFCAKYVLFRRVCRLRNRVVVSAYMFNSCVSDKEAADKRKLVSKWHPTTKGTLRRNYRVPSKSEGQRRLKAIAALLSEDDYFVDATSHKGCQIRRESAHGESVCCNNVRALFDELPTPHLLVEITAFPAGPLTEKDYVKAEKLERVLRSGPSI